MSQNAQSLENSVGTLKYMALSNRLLLLCLCGFYASSTTLTAQQAVTSAAAAKYAALSDRQLDEALLAVLS